MEDLLPFYIYNGVSKAEFMDSEPRELECYDLAYKFSAYKEDFYPFFNEFQDAKSGEWALVTPQATKVTNTRSQVLMTLGFRF